MLDKSFKCAQYTEFVGAFKSSIANAKISVVIKNPQKLQLLRVF